jgi:hypothetical protein
VLENASPLGLLAHTHQSPRGAHTRGAAQMRLSAAAWGELPLEKAQESLPSQATASAGVCAAGHHKVYPDMQVAKRARERSPEAGLLDALPHKKSLWRVHSGAQLCCVGGPCLCG